MTTAKTSLSGVPTPALVFDLDRLEANILHMAERARRLGVRLRPHIKTHKCIDVARLQHDAGCSGFTVSTLHEARVFAEHGFEDLTWAVPVTPSRLDEARALGERITLRLLVDSMPAVEALEATGSPFHVWLKVDCGYHRAGVDPEGAAALRLARRLAESTRLRFDGLLTHSGHAYKATSRAQLRRIAEQERAVMVRLARRLGSEGIHVPAVSVGSTPAMSVVTDLSGVDEARPGNYVFYDLMQVELGACSVGDCAATLVATVISAQPGASHCVIDAGALALSKDPGLRQRDDPGMGGIYDDHASGRLSSEMRLHSLSQEHGLVSPALPFGSGVRILPHHACLTVACFDVALVVRGEEVVDRWRIWNGRG